MHTIMAIESLLFVSVEFKVGDRFLVNACKEGSIVSVVTLFQERLMKYITSVKLKYVKRSSILFCLMIMSTTALAC